MRGMSDEGGILPSDAMLVATLTHYAARSKEEGLAAMRKRAQATVDEAANPNPPPDRCSENAKAFLIAYGELCKRHRLMVVADGHSHDPALSSIAPFPYRLPGDPATEAEVLAEHLRHLTAGGD